jgi:hypothetical protein
MYNADTLQCPDQPALEPMGTSGDQKTFTINVSSTGLVTLNKALTTQATLVLDDVLNDTESTNNTTSIDTTIVQSVVLTSQNFQTTGPDDFSDTSVTTSPQCGDARFNAAQTFLGLFSNQTLTYTHDLQPHNMVEISFDLYLPYIWDGNHAGNGPDRWKFCVGECSAPENSLFKVDTTFSNSNEAGYFQSFPDPFGEGDHPSFTGAASVNTLGYSTELDGSCTPTSKIKDSIYKFRFLLNDHTDPNLILNFLAEGLEAGEREEKWGIDNFKIILHGTNIIPVYLPFLRKP